MVARCVSVGVVLAGFFAVPPGAAQEGSAGNSAKSIFGPTKVHEFHLEVTPVEWTKMQATGGKNPFAGMFGLGGPKDKTPDKDVPKSTDIHKGGGFGLEFPWVYAALTAEGKTYTDIGVRYKGNGSYLPSTGQLRRNLKIDLDRYHEGQTFHGLKQITLNSGAADPTRYREALAYPVYRAAGVPAPRVALAEVTLTVPGKYDKEMVGLFTFVESVDKKFLKDNFRDGSGLLLKPEPKGGGQRKPFDFVGEDWDKYKAWMAPKREPTKAEARRVMDFARLIHQASDAEFRRDIASYLDVDGFLRFFAVTALVCNMDSMFTIGHNVLIYLNPKTNQFVFMPWDLDLSFGGFFFFGTPSNQADISVKHPYGGSVKLVDRLLDWQDAAEKYKKILEELTTTCFTKEKLLADIEAIDKAAGPILEKEKSAAKARKENSGGGFGFAPIGGPDQGSTTLRTFVEKRVASVSAQIAGTSKGMIPSSGIGFGFGFGAPKKEKNDKK